MPTSTNDGLLQYMADALIGIDRNGKVLIWAGSAESMFGYSKEEALSRDFTGWWSRRAAQRIICWNSTRFSILESRPPMNWFGAARTAR